MPAATSLRRANARDFPALRELEQTCFQPYRQASPASLRRSLSSRRQSVWVLESAGPNPLVGLLILWHHPNRVRVYDIATHPDHRGAGVGRTLMRHAESLARRAGASWMTLEADPKERGLVRWYERQGYASVRRLTGYYKNGNVAVRMVKRLR